jgi:hypothetical protein
MSIEFGIDEAIRRASASTNGRLATTRRFWAAATGWARMSSPVSSPDSFAIVPTAARYRNGDTNQVDCVQILSTVPCSFAVSRLDEKVCWRGLFRNCGWGEGAEIAEFVNFLTNC